MERPDRHRPSGDWSRCTETRAVIDAGPGVRGRQGRRTHRGGAALTVASAGRERRMTEIPWCDPARSYAEHAPEFDEAARRVLASGRYILGPEVAAFEHESAAYLGAHHAVGVSSGTEALWLSLRALGIGPGDAVLTT